MNINGLVLGAAVFLIIGICHPIVIKLEYHIGRKSWWIMLLAGLVFSLASIIVLPFLVSSILGAFAFSCFWSILEIFQQEKRVVKGWFPENPKRHEYYESLRNT